MPYVFTEHGVLMLSSVLSSDRAVNVNIQVMRIFTRIRKTLIDTTDLRYELEKIKDKLENNDKSMEVVFSYLDELLKKESVALPRKRIGFKPDDL